MDESWRMSIRDGFVRDSSSRRRSIERDRRTNPDPADGDDFRDVFGGPPRNLLLPSRPGAGFCNEAFSPPASAAAAGGAGRRNLNLPRFCLPFPNNSTSARASNRRLLGSVRTEDGFYDDIFGSSSTTKSSNSGNNCKSRSYNHDSSFHRHANHLGSLGSKAVYHHHHDATLSSFASKLRPITIPTRQHDSSWPAASSRGGGESSNRTLPISGRTTGFSRQYLHRPGADDFSYSPSSPSAETNSYCANCCRKPSGRMTNNNAHHSSDIRSPSSAIFGPMMSTTTPIELGELEKKVVVEVKPERERSFANRHFVQETEGAAALDEAIAWAREKFWNQQASDRLGFGEDEIFDYSEEAAKENK